MPVQQTEHQTQGSSPSQNPVPVESGGQTTPRIQLRGLTKSFAKENGEITRAVNEIDLDIQPGEFLILLGPSGCGKTTLLRSIAGLETPDAGRVTINGAVLFDRGAKISVPVERRPVSMVFQSYGLWPHMTVFENIAYPLRSQRVPGGEIQRRVERVMESAGIGAVQSQYPTQLSGGQQQRVALARAVVSANDVVLFDEPLSNVDAKVRDQLRMEILRMQRELGFTAVYVTHDQDEAMMLGHRIAVLDNGNVAQLGTPREIYETPASPYVARFIGAVDEGPGRVSQSLRGSQGILVETPTGGRWRVTQGKGLTGEVILMTRPERWTISHEPVSGENVLQGEVRASLYLAGSRTECLVQTAAGLIRVWSPHGKGAAEGEVVWISAAPEDVIVFGGAS